MPRSRRLSPWAATLLACAPAAAQTQSGGVAPPPRPEVAATVNGQPVMEASVQRGLKRVPLADHPKARPDILNYLVDNLLLDQFLAQQKIDVAATEVNSRVAEIQAEVKRNGQEYANLLRGLALTEDELKSQIAADLRWEKYCNSQATDAALRELFAKSSDVFDGTQVRARHILLTPPTGGEAAAKSQLAAIKSELEAGVAKEMAKLPATADPLARETERCRKLDEAFGVQAEKFSTCPSKKDGGDLSWFPRMGSMEEKFAATAFALKPGQLSEPIQTQFGHHLILCSARKQGAPTKFEDIKDDVKEVYCTKMRETLVAKMRPTAKIVIAPAK